MIIQRDDKTVGPIIATMNPDRWNMLFGWMTGKRCFLPEGCSAPISGIMIYIVIITAIIAAIHYREDILSFIKSI